MCSVYTNVAIYMCCGVCFVYGMPHKNANVERMH